MKTNKYLLYIIVLCTFLFEGCQEEVNQWKVEERNKLFKPLVFDVVEARATSVELKYTKSISADKYIFEFSEDSLAFNEIIIKKEVMADTLTPFSSSTTETRTEFRTVFDELSGSTGYSVRMHVIDTTSGLQSDPWQLYFETAAEQLFTTYFISTSEIQLHWTPTDRVTTLVVTNLTTGNVLEERTLSEDEITNATAVVDELVPGTVYQFDIYNETKVRGSLTLETSGLSGSTIIEVMPTDDIPTLITDAVNSGSGDITLTFDGNETYDIGSLTIPAGVSNLSFTGIPGTEGSMPVLNMTELRFTELIFEDIVIENVKIVGDYGKYFMYLSGDGIAVEDIMFKNCDLRDFRSLVRLSNNTIDVNSLVFDDCLINNIGGYGVVNIGGTTPTVDTVSFSNSTLTELATQLVDVRCAVSEFYVGNCTFVNLATSMSQLLRFEISGLPLSVTTENNIIAGNNAGAKLNALSYDQSSYGLQVSFGGSYITNDIEINKYPFENITLFNGSTHDLFVDADNGDFSIDPATGFGGYGVAGDPRWFD